MKRFLAFILMVGLVAGITGCKDDAKERIALRTIKLAAMEYGYNARSWFEWGEKEQAAYDLIMTGDINKPLIDSVKSYVKTQFKNPVVAQGVVEIIDEAGLQFDEAGNLIATVANQYSVKYIKSATEGFYLGVTAK